MLVPPLMVFLSKHPVVDKYDLSSLKEIWCGAAPLSKETQLAVKKRIGLKVIKQGYGLTETTLAVLHNGDSKAKFGSCGLVVPGTTAKVLKLFIFIVHIPKYIYKNSASASGCRFDYWRISWTLQRRRIMLQRAFDDVRIRW